MPVNGLNALNDVQLLRRNVGFLDNDQTNTRNVIATFDLINRTAINFNNFTLYAVNVPDNLGGTGIIAMTAGTGLAITDPDVPRGFKPTHAMRTLVQGLEVNPSSADLQFFTPDETTDILNQAVLSSILTNADTVLEYGFVARNYAGGRVIGPRNTGTDCTSNACKGTFTLAYQFPKLNPRSANPFTFSLYFVVANETVQMGSQSLEEQTPNTAMGLSNPTGFGQLRTLAGSSFGIFNDELQPLCRVKTAIGPDLFLGPDPIPSAPGSLDICFGAGGKRATAIGPSNDYAHSIAVQPNGKIVVAGYNSTSPNSDFALVRYNTDGSLDTSFGTGGKVTTAIGLSHDIANSLAIQPNGKIVVAGFSFGSNSDFTLVRYNDDGSLDTSFDTDGKVTTPIGSSEDLAYSLAIQPNGMIVVAGDSYNGSNFDFALVRYNPSGSLDTTFGTGGKVTTAIGPSNDRAQSLALQSDGKIVVAGRSGTFPNYDFALVRYNTDGSLDTSFDTDGKVTTAIGPSNDEASSLAIQSDDKIVVAGFSFGSNYDFALVRYNDDGSLDTSFDTDGKVTTAIGPSNDLAYSIAIQPNGMIVVAGSSNTGGNNHFALVRYSTDGLLDTTFGMDGKVTTPIGSTSDEARSLALQSDGKIVLAGSSNNGSNDDFALVRYNP